MARTFPIIDLFAGPGGLSEGFSTFETSTGRYPFQVRLSIEKEATPHLTLELRAFFRQFPVGQAPEEYYDYLRGSITRKQLFDSHPLAAKKAAEEAWCAELGKTPHEEVMKRIHGAMHPNCDRWVLIGGPPCQAYSLAGRSRRVNDVGFASDKRHFLYKEYLRIIAERLPAVFVMENVQGIISSRSEDEGIFQHILRDLQWPRAAVDMDEPESVHYSLYPINGDSVEGTPRLPFDDQLPDAKAFVVRADRYNIPQARPRVFILGIRSDIKWQPQRLKPSVTPPPSVWQAIGDLPPLRSQISRGRDIESEWFEHVKAICWQPWMHEDSVAVEVRKRICTVAEQMQTIASTGSNWLPQEAHPQWNFNWYYDERLGGICNHEARSHMASDLWRYLFAAVFAEVQGRSPLLRDFPSQLRPAHQNVNEALKGNDLFSDRFRVQLRNRPSTTVVSHISKDGHYYIHPDPFQCRSLTVREAARLQTFKDNYFFEGTRTAQYHQVGNAVPPLLARQIAEIVYEVLR